MLAPMTASPDWDPAEIPVGALGETMGMTLIEAHPDRVVVTMPVEGNTQPFGLLHGGASAALIETAGSIGAALHAGPGSAVVGLDINATHHRGVRGGEVTATATPLSLGKTLTSYEVRITDDAGRLACTGRLTCLIRPLGNE